MGITPLAAMKITAQVVCQSFQRLEVTVALRTTGAEEAFKGVLPKDAPEDEHMMMLQFTFRQPAACLYSHMQRHSHA